MFPPTIKRTETAMDQVGQTDRKMTYFLSSRAMSRQYVYCVKLRDRGLQRRGKSYIMDTSGLAAKNEEGGA